MFPPQKRTGGKIRKEKTFQKLTLPPSHPDFGIFLAFCISNWALVYFFIYTVRVRGWSFGLNHVFGRLGRAVGAVKKAVRGLGGGGGEEKAARK